MIKAISLDIGSPPFKVVHGESSVERNLSRDNFTQPKNQFLIQLNALNAIVVMVAVIPGTF